MTADRLARLLHLRDRIDRDIATELASRARRHKYQHDIPLDLADRPLLIIAGVSLATLRDVIDEVIATGRVDIDGVTITVHQPQETP